MSTEQPNLPPITTPPSGWLRWLPGLLMLKHYQLAWLPKDIIAGLVLTTMLVPVGIAYAEASGVPGIYGLYATIVPLLAYALFGPSRILVLGPDSSLAALILAVVLPLSGGDPLRAVTLASMMAVVAGLVCILAGLLRLGFITELLSKPIRYGYMNGIALTVLISQLPKLFGISIDGEGPVRDLVQLGQGVLAGQTNLYSLAVGAGCLALILLLKRFKQLPTILIAVVLATLAVGLFDLDSARASRCWASCRRACLPSPCRGSAASTGRPWRWAAWPWRWCPLPTPACCRAPMRRAPARHVDPNQEMVGLGAANLVGGLLSGLPDQQQLLAHASGRSRRLQNPAHRRRRRPGRGGAADVGAQPAEEPAHQRPWRRW